LPLNIVQREDEENPTKTPKKVQNIDKQQKNM
jgi:hypothetical protein